jgi:zinc protease
MASLVEGRERDPEALFHDSVVTALAGNDPRAIRNGARFYLRTRMDDALDFWTRRTANGAGFTVAFVGDFTLARVRPLIERYLASIPRGAAERPRDRGIAIVTRGVRRNVPSGIAPRARAAIGFAMPFTLSNDNLNALYMMREVVTRSLTDRLRDQLGATYDVDVSLAIDLVPPSRYTMTVEFESSPENIEALTAAALDELARLRRSGPSDAQYRAAREARVRDFDGRADDNDYWVSELTFHARHGWPLSGIAAHRREVESITLEDVRRACATYLPAKDFVRITMRPDSRPRLSAHLR